MSGDTLFLNFFTADSGTQQIGFSARSPGKIIPFKLDGTNTIIGQKNAFLAAEDSVELEIYFKNKLGTGIFGGEGFILQKFSGEGIVFLEIDGEVIEHDLQEGETLLLDPGHLDISLQWKRLLDMRLKELKVLKTYCSVKDSSLLEYKALEKFGFKPCLSAN